MLSQFPLRSYFREIAFLISGKGARFLFGGPANPITASQTIGM
jgi:hypothetical protein